MSLDSNDIQTYQPLTLNSYQLRAAETAVYPPEHGINYCLHGLTNEAGEVSGVYKKHLRGDYDAGALREKLKKELGDTLWYLAMSARECGWSLEDIALANLQKLAKRADEGTLRGDGDNR